MERSWKTLFLLTTCCTLGLMTSVRAQVSSDGTLSTTVTSPNNLNFTINNGNRVGGNLFHSFREFSVPNGGSAVFQNAADVQNIISRVTGGSLSQINGLIQAQGSANLFLLNPAGISFGQNARLSIGGSFFATTADSLLFDNGIEFSATNPQAPLLTVNIPIGLRFRDNPGNITNQSVVQDNTGFGVGLQVNPGNSLALVGGNVSLEQGGRLTAAGGRIELGGLAGAGTVGLQTTGNTFTLNFPTNGLSNVSLVDNARVAVRSNGGGDIAVNANIFTGRNGGQLVAGIEGIATRNGGDIIVNTNDISFDGVSSNGSIGIFNTVQGNAVGNAGGIDITTKNLSFTNGSQINSSTFGRGNAGNVTLRAENGDISLAGRSLIFSTVESGGIGNAGKIDIITRNLSLTDGSQLQSLVIGGEQQSNAGNITVQASGTVRIAGGNSNGNRSTILSNVLSGSGNAGNIIINAGSIFTDNLLLLARNDGNGSAGNISLQVGDAIALTNGSSISSSISGRGNAGNVTLRAENGDISIAGGSNILNGVDSGGIGNAGKIDIITRNLSLTDGAQLQALVNAGGLGNAGNITVKASGTVRIAGGNSNGNRSTILSNVLSGSGNAGNIIINAGSIFTDDALLIARNDGNGSAGNISLQVGDAIALTNGSSISSSISGRGNAGNVTLRAENGDISIAGGSNILNSVESGGMGNAGKIDIITRNLSLTDGALLQTLVSGGEQQSNAGNITVQASGTVRIAGGNSNENPTGILSNVLSGSGNGGNIIINAGSIFTDNALLIARNQGNGSAGNISLQVGDAIALTNNSQINSSISGRGNAGNVTLQAENGDISLAGRSSILNSVESGGMGNAGKIDIITRNLSLTDGVQLQALVSGGEQQSNAGNITVQASGTVRIAGGNSNENRSRILSNVLSGASGNGGNIIINAGSIFTDNALLTARNDGNGLAGDITLNARDQVSLNQSRIESDGNSGNGGDITLNIGNFLRLQNESLISANARGQQGGNGGNITINTPFIVAFPQNNDITANAGRGSGGQVIINATLFGIAPLSAADLRRLRPNDLDPRQLSTNDITAISRDNPSLNNNVQVTSPDVDPSRGLVELPETVSDRTQQVAQNPCRQNFGNEFVVTGRGGLPTSPNETLSSNNVRVDLLQPVASYGNSPSATVKPATTVTATRVPAQGWIFNNKGQVVLTAYDPTNTGSQRPFSTAACSGR
jgi:filamentous hemagglutinin family protein